jgi:hypothetical protein
MDHRALVLVFVFLSIPIPGWCLDGVEIKYGANNPICRVAIRMVRDIPPTDFWGGAWRKRFGDIDWNKGSYPTITAVGKYWGVEYQYLVVDVDADGNDEVLVRTTDMISSVDFDSLYFFEYQQFSAAQKENTVGSLLRTVPILNPGNGVRFSNGEESVPVEVQIWKYQGQNILILREHFFARNRRGVPNSLFVSKFNRQSLIHKTAPNQQVIPDLICRIRSEAGMTKGSSRN